MMGAARNKPISPTTEKTIPTKGTMRKPTIILTSGFLSGRWLIVTLAGENNPTIPARIHSAIEIQERVDIQQLPSSCQIFVDYK